MKNILEGSRAVAQAAARCRPDVVAAYPITPQTHIVEDMAKMVADGELDTEYVNTESEFSALSVLIGASAAGVRTYTATSSQGLALMHEVLFNASGMRLPIVMTVANRALSSPINIWNDTQDTMSERDSGWLQLYAETNQEAADMVVQSYKIAEDKDVLLPVMACMDGFVLTHTMEPVDIPGQKDVDGYLPKYNPTHAFLDPEKPMTQGPIGYPSVYQEMREEQQKVMIASKRKVVKENKQFAETFGRAYGDGLLEEYKTKDADVVLFSFGSVCGTIKDVVDEKRKEGKKVGLVRMRCFRPFPEEEVKKVLSGFSSVGVLEKDMSIGFGAPVYHEVRSAMYSSGIPLLSYVGGLGGRDIRPADISKAFDEIGKAKKSDSSPRYMNAVPYEVI